MTVLHITYGPPVTSSIDQVLAAIAEMDRVALARLVDRAIERMDEADGDPDEEAGDDDQCMAADDGCAPFLHAGTVRWGFEGDVS